LLELTHTLAHARLCRLVLRHVDAARASSEPATSTQDNPSPFSAKTEPDFVREQKELVSDILITNIGTVGFRGNASLLVGWYAVLYVA